MPRWNTISISGYHIREAGSTALQELAFTLRDGMEYVAVRRRRRPATSTSSRRGSPSSSTATTTSSRRSPSSAPRAQIWAKVMRDRYGAKNPRSWMLRFHTQTAGCSLTAQQPYNNIVRVDDPGAGGGARRHAVAAHQLARRDAGPADRGERRASRCGRSRSSPTSRASSTRSIRSAAATSSRR